MKKLKVKLSPEESARKAEKARESNRKYRLKNPEKICESQREYKLKNPEKIRESNRKYALNNREKIRERHRKYRLNNPEKVREWGRKWRRSHLEEVAKKQREYRVKNKEKLKAYFKKYEETRRKNHRNTSLCTMFNGKMVHIRGLLKRSYPESKDCELCGKSNLRLKYHHWMDTAFILASPRSATNPLYVPGLWVCQPCDMFCHKLEDYPMLPKKMEILKQEAEGYISKLVSTQRLEGTE